MQKIPSPTPFDWFNNAAQDKNSNTLIQAVAKFDCMLDYDLIQKALQNCIIEDPVLGCRLNLKDKANEWLFINPNISDICRFIDTNNENETIELRNFLAESIDSASACPIKIALLRNGNSDILAVKTHHAACDGGGTTQFVRMLANNYSELLRNSNYIPTPKVIKRDYEAFYEYFNVTDKAKRFNPSLLEMKQPTWGTPIEDANSEQSFAYQKLNFDKSVVDNIKRFAKDNSSSLNAVITTAYHQALTQLLQPEDPIKEIQFSANLRKYSNKKDFYTLGNMSNMYNIDIATKGNFADLAHKTKLLIDKVLEPEQVLQSVIVCELMTTDYDAMNSYYSADWDNVKQTGLCTPMISNIGVLDLEPIYFGNSIPKEMEIVPPAFVAPSFMLSASTYNNKLTLSSAYQKPSTSDEFVSNLLNKINIIINNLN